MKYSIAVVAALIAGLLILAPEVKSQTIRIYEQPCNNGEGVGQEITKLKIDMMKENFVYVLVSFPSAYGCNQIKLKRFNVGDPSPVDTKDVDPSTTWACFEVYLTQTTEYTFTIFDCNDVEIGKTTFTSLPK